MKFGLTENFDKLLKKAQALIEADELVAADYVAFYDDCDEASGTDVRMVKTVYTTILEQGIRRLNEIDREIEALETNAEIVRVKMILCICDEFV